MNLLEKRAVNQAREELQAAMGVLMSINDKIDDIDKSVISANIESVLNLHLNEINECLNALKLQ